ncbi:hypothetical protein E4U09_005804 [Claviceps aff. purpurea]|uniref:Uncharacterized protein n=1 Tax=Claviceps aff. purpurea TaxID=1967640 RepID=A0A9P7QKV1_9HYPO|nr:hypothetical protein E4U09_005804 [Claviceps aff. purpurea]
MSPFLWALRIVHAFEDRIIEAILRQPGFHRAVGRIHRTIHERKHGRNPNEPLAPGEATGISPPQHTEYRALKATFETSDMLAADPELSERRQTFTRHFMDELKRQFSGKPSNLSDKHTHK